MPLGDPYVPQHLSRAVCERLTDSPVRVVPPRLQYSRLGPALPTTEHTSPTAMVWERGRRRVEVFDGARGKATDK